MNSDWSEMKLVVLLASLALFLVVHGSLEGEKLKPFTCAARRKCVASCRRISCSPKPPARVCPRSYQRCYDNIQRFCQNDHDCSGGRKCCRKGCAFRCVKSIYHKSKSGK
ncbi:Uncharacterised protein g2452 [Pycnogonum litorale]